MDGILDSLISMISDVKYESEYCGSKNMYPVISKNHMPLVKAAVVEWYDIYFGGEYARKIGELEAKVYAYEKIIANSNFASITQPPPGMDDDMPKKVNDSDPYGIDDFQAGHRRY